MQQSGRLKVFLIYNDFEMDHLDYEFCTNEM